MIRKSHSTGTGPRGRGRCGSDRAVEFGAEGRPAGRGLPDRPGPLPEPVTSWTTAPARTRSRPPPATRCSSTDRAARADPLAVGYLIGQGLSPSQVTSWTTGACSHQVKAASCYAMFQSAAAS